MWMVLVLISSLIVAGNSVLDKYVMGERQAHPLVCTTSFGVVALPLAIAGLILLPLPPWPEALAGLTAGAVFAGAVWLYYDTVAREDISRLVPLLRLSTVLTLLLGVGFLGEVLSLRQEVACAAMVAGGIVLSLTAAEGRPRVSRMAVRMLPVAGLLAINSVLNAHVYRTLSLWHGLAWEAAGISLAVLAITACAVRRRRCFWEGTDRRTWRLLIGEQITRECTNLAPAWAVAHGVAVGLPGALNGITPLWVWLLALLILRERTSRQDVLYKAAGIGGMIAGIYLLL